MHLAFAGLDQATTEAAATAGGLGASPSSLADMDDIHELAQNLLSSELPALDPATAHSSLHQSMALMPPHPPSVETSLLREVSQVGLSPLGENA